MLTIDRAVYADVAGSLAQANQRGASTALALLDAIGDAAVSAGRGDATRSWCTAYEAKAERVTQQLSHLVEAFGTCAVLVDTSGHNHARAEIAAAPYGLPDYALSPVQRALASVSTTGIPTMYGGNSDQPWSWGLVSSHVLSAWWPGADLPRVRALAAAWHDAAADLRTTAYFPSTAVAYLETLSSPELPDAIDACRRLAQACDLLADDCDTLGTACTTFARHVAEQRDQVNHLLKEFCAAAGITELIALGASVLSAGISELVSKAVDSGLMARFALRISAALDVLSRALQSGGMALAIADASDGLSGWLPKVADAAPVLAAIADDDAQLAVGLGVALPFGATGSPSVTDEEIIDAGWANRKTLARHLRDHGKDVGATTMADYVRAAQALLRQARAEGLPTKVAEDGDILVFDPATKLFAVYRPDGKARTIFRPDEPSDVYWHQQRGALQ